MYRLLGDAEFAASGATASDSPLSTDAAERPAMAVAPAVAGDDAALRRRRCGVEQAAFPLADSSDAFAPIFVSSSAILRWSPLISEPALSHLVQADHAALMEFRPC